jgi:hypothetical protein
VRQSGLIVLAALVMASPAFAPLPAFAQATESNSGGAGAINSGGAGMIGGPAASAGLKGTGVVKLPDNQPHNATPSPGVGAGYGTPGNVGNTGDASNSGVGAGVQSDIRTGVKTSPNTP